MARENLKDPCAEFGPTQRWAVVWMISVIILGSLLTYKLACIDSRQYEKKGRYLDYKAYKENRLATTSIASERVDTRQKMADYSSIQAEVSQ